MPPIVNCAWGKLVSALDHPHMFAQELSFGGDHQTFWINPQAHRAVGEGRWNAVAVALEADQAGRGHPLTMFDEAIKGRWQRHQRGLFCSPDVGNAAGQCCMRDLVP